MASSGNQGGAAAAVPCKAQVLADGSVQIAAADKPLKCKLSTPDNKTQIVSVSVFIAGTVTPVNGQPGNQTATSFSLDPPVGSYDVVVTVGFTPDATGPVVIVEDCDGQTRLKSINVPTANNGRFRVVVV